MILNVVSKVTEYPKEEIYLGVDGCGVPVFGLPIKNMSCAYARIANWELLPLEYQQSAKRIFLSMIRYPEIVGGTDRFDTDLMRISEGNKFDTDLMRISEGKLLAKSGADGVFCIGVRNNNNNKGIGITIKMESGNMKFLPMVVIQVLSKKWAHLFQTLNLEKYKKIIVKIFTPSFFLP